MQAALKKGCLSFFLLRKNILVILFFTGKDMKELHAMLQAVEGRQLQWYWEFGLGPVMCQTKLPGCCGEDAEDTCFVMSDRMIPKGDVKTPRQFKEFADGMQCTVLHERICSVENCTI